MTDPKHEELVLAGIVSNPQPPIRFFSDFHFKNLGVRSQNFWNLFRGALCSFFLRLFSQECPKCLETV